MSPVLELARALIHLPSVTPEDHGCQALIAERLVQMDFRVESMPFGEVSNFWARRGIEPPLVCLVGHTDVVPPGPYELWTSDPFDPVIRDGRLYGRGAADMKGALAAMVVAVESFVAAHPDHPGSIACLLTSDEEGPAVNGTAKVIERLQRRGELIDYAIVGEPSSIEQLGDSIKHGRRGSLTGFLAIHGKQGHVAYPERAKNPFHASVQALAALCAEVWDQGNEYFPPTSFQIANLSMGTGADNVIPGRLDAQFNLRFSTAIDPDTIKRRICAILDQGDFEYEIAWRLSGLPFLTPIGTLIEATRAAIREVCGTEPDLSTGGGTSDGRFIAPTGAQVVEVGPVNATIHQVDEWIAVDELERLPRLYQRILERLLLGC
ncbi:succinyl-diaminopimelate desuccinylase [Caldichromatium japonicum]|uniref:Succinyl-diaminopimelate desuccinylase n=1 Tax=Caldichromatium japonicum TaxID=2699430 RepID=A0A6G7VEK6_9GAMM|nr:succinyl-diaminopimelate desuccinylase [Caldichromatium japonicum]QIK38340.1 succinyl-diaminopimelate desuccinylase [Caldichromatium japonicum]